MKDCIKCRRSGNEGVEKKIEDTEVRNIGMIDKTVFYLKKNAYYTINLSEQTDSLKCHKHHIVYHVIGEFHKRNKRGNYTGEVVYRH